MIRKENSDKNAEMVNITFSLNMNKSIAILQRIGFWGLIIFVEAFSWLAHYVPNIIMTHSSAVYYTTTVVIGILYLKIWKTNKKYWLIPLIMIISTELGEMCDIITGLDGNDIILRELKYSGMRCVILLVTTILTVKLYVWFSEKKVKTKK